MFLYEIDLSKYNDGDVFKEYQTAGGSAPGNVVIDNDGEKALLFGIPGNWMTFKDKFGNIATNNGSINVASTVRMEDPRWGAYVEMYAFDGVGAYNGYVKWSIFNGQMYLSAYNSWQECQYNKTPLATILCGPVDASEHEIRVQFTGKTVYIQFDDKSAVGLITKPGAVVDSLRVRAIGLMTSQDPKTKKVSKYRCALIKSLKVEEKA